MCLRFRHIFGNEDDFVLHMRALNESILIIKTCACGKRNRSHCHRYVLSGDTLYIHNIIKISLILDNIIRYHIIPLHLIIEQETSSHS